MPNPTAQPIPRASLAHWAIYADLGYPITTFSAFLRTDYRVSRRFAAGLGVGLITGTNHFSDTEKTDLSLTVETRFLLGPSASPHSLELAAGVLAIPSGQLRKYTFDSGPAGISADLIYPTVLVGYSYQPLQGGFMLRSGFRFGNPFVGFLPALVVSLGYAF